MHTDGVTHGRNDNRRHEKRAPSCQAEQAQGFVLGITQAAESCARPVSTSYYPKRRKRRLRFYLRSCSRKYDNRRLLGRDVIV